MFAPVTQFILCFDTNFICLKMETFNKYRVHVSATRGKRVEDSFVDLFTRESLDRVQSIVNVQCKRSFRFPFEVEVELLPQDEFLYQACSSVFQVVNVVASDFANIFYNGN